MFSKRKNGEPKLPTASTAFIYDMLCTLHDLTPPVRLCGICVGRRTVICTECRLAQCGRSLTGSKPLFGVFQIDDGLSKAVAVIPQHCSHILIFIVLHQYSRTERSSQQRRDFHIESKRTAKGAYPFRFYETRLYLLPDCNCNNHPRRDPDPTGICRRGYVDSC